MKKTTKVIVGSALSMALCASLIAGSTFALFSSESNVDVAITAGKVEVSATVDNLTGFSALWDAETSTYLEHKCEVANTFDLGGTFKYDGGDLTLSEIAPGDGVEFDLKIENKSSISIKYRVQLTVPEEEGVTQDKIVEALEVTVGTSDPTVIGIRSMLAQPWSEIAAGAPVDDVHIKVKLPITDGDQNEYAKQGCKLQIGVYAVQANAHVEDPNPDSALTIYSATDLYKFAKSVNDGNAYDGQVVDLASEIYLGDSVSKTSAVAAVAYVLADADPLNSAAEVWAPIGAGDNAFKGIFNGNNHTIYGLESKGESAGLFGVTENATIENLTLSGAAIEAAANGKAGALVAEARGELTVNGVKIENSTVKKAEGATSATVGALVGSASGSVSVENVDVQMNESETAFGGADHALVGEGTVSGTTDVVLEPVQGYVEKYTAENGKKTKASYEISTEAGLRYFSATSNGTTGEKGAIAYHYRNETITLLENIDLHNELWKPISGDMQSMTFEGIFDGNGKVISNLKVAAGRDPKSLNKTQWNLADGSSAGLFGHLGRAGWQSVIKNFTLKNVDIEAPLVNSVGAAVGSGGKYSTIEGVNVIGNIQIRGYQYVGGIVGATEGNIKNCTVKSTADIADTAYGIFANHQLGGIVGKLTGKYELSGNTVKNIRLYVEDTVLGDKDGTGWEGHGGISAKGVAGGLAGVLAYSSGSPTVKKNTLEDVIVDVTEVDEGFAMTWDTWNNSMPNVEQSQRSGQGFTNILLYPGLTGALAGNISRDGVYQENTGNVSIIDPYNVPLAIKQDYAEGGLFGGADVLLSRNTLENNTIRVLWDGILLKRDGWHIENSDMLEAFRDMVNGGEVKSSFNNGTGAADNKADYKYLWMNHDFSGETVYLDGDFDLESVQQSIVDVEVMKAARTARGAALSVSNYKYHNEDKTYGGPQRFEADIAFKGTLEKATV